MALAELFGKYIKFPGPFDEVNWSITSFADLTNLPSVASAIDGSQVRIRALTASNSAPHYFSRYQQHDYITQANVDGKNNYVDFTCGIPRRIHDARVLRCSTIFQRATQGEPKPAKCECEIGPYVLGDSACLSSPWLMKPYPKGTRHPREIVFNKDLSFGGVKVECGFVVLKDRCRILSRSSSR